MTPQELKKWRLKQGYKQIELAELLGVTDQTVFRWETERREIPSFLQLALECLEKKGGRVETKGIQEKMAKKKTQRKLKSVDVRDSRR